MVYPVKEVTAAGVRESDAGRGAGMKCAQCGETVQDGWRFCPWCTACVPDCVPEEEAAGGIEVRDAAVKEVRQEVTGAGGGISVADSAVGKITQEVNAEVGIDEASVEAVRGLASINVTEGVVKEIHQVVNVYMGAGQSLDAVFGASAARGLRSRLVYVACGREIRAFRPDRGGPGADAVGVYSLPETMGSARSVRLVKAGDRLMVLAGARLGVVAFDTRTADAMVYAFPGETRYGANAATVYDDHLYATHSDFGLLCWPIDGGEATSIRPEMFEDAATVRGVQVSLRGELLICAGPSVYGIDVSHADARPVEYSSPGKQRLVGAVECGEHVYAAASDGKVLRWDADMPHHSGAVIADVQCKTYCLSLVQMPGGPHLVLGTKSGHVRLIRLVGPQAVVDYHTPGGASIRWARAAPDLLVASDSGGARLFFWRPGETAHPSRTVPVTSRAKGLITDLCILSK